MVVLSLVFLGVWGLLRAALWIFFGARSGVSAPELLLACGLGAVNDSVVLLYVLIPLTLVAELIPNRLRRSPLYRWMPFGLGWLSLFAVLYLCAVEFFFFEEFDSRFNLVAVDYLLYPHEVLVNIWDSYPVPAVILLALVTSGVLITVLWRKLLHDRWVDLRPRRRAVTILACLLLMAALVAAPGAGRLEAFSNRVAGEIATNGISSFFEALRTNEIDYHTYYPARDSEAMFRLLARHLQKGGNRLTHLAEGRLDRRFVGHSGLRGLGSVVPTAAVARGGVRRAGGTGLPRFAPRLASLRQGPEEPGAEPAFNVVVIVEESFGAEFIGAYGATGGLTPYFDALADDGLLFSRAYATGTRTVRGLEAIVASFPPIPSVSIVRRPGNEDIATWGKVMRRRGYHTSFLYGGYSYFDNMSYFFSRNGFQVSDRIEIENPTFANIWGVCDEDLFRHALRSFDDFSRRGRPFFSIVLTTSNHKPFTFPPGVPGVPEQGGGREAGVRYADYALGRLFAQARRYEWFDQTVFAVVGDHGARVYGADEIPLHSYEIPIFFYAPALLKPARVATPMSQIDIAPTVLGLLGESYEAPFFGQDILLARADVPRTLLFNHNHDVAVLRGEDMVVLGLHKTVEGFSYRAEAERLQPATPDPELTDLAIAYFQTAYEQFENGVYR